MAVKNAVLAARLASPDSLFPDYFATPDQDKVEEEARARGDDIEYDYSDVKWDMPTGDGQDPEETLRLVQAMGANLSLSVGDDDWTPEPEPDAQAVLALDEAEREWL